MIFIQLNTLVDHKKIERDGENVVLAYFSVQDIKAFSYVEKYGCTFLKTSSMSTQQVLEAPAEINRKIHQAFFDMFTTGIKFAGVL
jgi:hypothetical protein